LLSSSTGDISALSKKRVCSKRRMERNIELDERGIVFSARLFLSSADFNFSPLFNSYVIFQFALVLFLTLNMYSCKSLGKRTLKHFLINIL
jgi:hypothetical protein